MHLAIAMKLWRQNVEVPATTGASPSIEFIMLQGHSGHDRNLLSKLYPAIGTRIRCRKALIYACLLHADARLYGLACASSSAAFFISLSKSCLYCSIRFAISRSASAMRKSPSR